MNLSESRTQGYLGEIFFFIFYHGVEIQVSREILQLVLSLLFSTASSSSDLRRGRNITEKHYYCRQPMVLLSFEKIFIVKSREHSDLLFLLILVTFRHFQVIFTPCLIGPNFAV